MFAMLTFINNRPIATIQASFIVSFVRLFTIDYCITNLAAIKTQMLFELFQRLSY